MIRLIAIMFVIASSAAYAEISPVENNQINEQKDYLKDRIPQYDKRYLSMKMALDLISERKAKILLETGTARYGLNGFIGDGSATLIFGDWAQANDATLFSVDINPSAIARAKGDLGINEHVQFVCEDSISYLKQFNQYIDFLYLDSYDFDANNPVPSQEHHLKEIEAAYSRLHDYSIIMIDDCDLPHGGKGALVIPFLIERGWKMLINKYQVIFVKDETIPK